jgi:hypothetical protein
MLIMIFYYYFNVCCVLHGDAHHQCFDCGLSLGCSKKRVYVYDDDDEEYGEGEEIEKNRFIFSLNSIYNSIPEVIYKRKHSDSSTMDE